MAAADTLSKDHHLRAMATMRVLPYVPLTMPYPALFFLFLPICRSRSLRLVVLGPADASKMKQQKGDDNTKTRPEERPD